MTINKLRRALYTGARILGDVQAVRRGPMALAKRIARKMVLRRVGKFIR